MTDHRLWIYETFRRKKHVYDIMMLIQMHFHMIYEI